MVKRDEYISYYMIGQENVHFEINIISIIISIRLCAYITHTNFKVPK